MEPYIGSSIQQGNHAYRANRSARLLLTRGHEFVDALFPPRDLAQSELVRKLREKGALDYDYKPGDTSFAGHVQEAAERLGYDTARRLGRQGAKRAFDRREAVLMLAAGGAGILIYGCGDSKSPTAPSNGGGNNLAGNLIATILDSYGQPVSGANATLYSDDNGTNAMGNAVTDANGIARFQNIANLILAKRMGIRANGILSTLLYTPQYSSIDNVDNFRVASGNAAMRDHYNQINRDYVSRHENAADGLKLITLSPSLIISRASFVPHPAQTFEERVQQFKVGTVDAIVRELFRQPFNYDVQNNPGTSTGNGIWVVHLDNGNRAEPIFSGNDQIGGNIHVSGANAAGTDYKLDRTETANTIHLIAEATDPTSIASDDSPLGGNFNTNDLLALAAMDVETKGMKTANGWDSYERRVASGSSLTNWLINFLTK